MIKENKGITLVALVITIIVMMILVAVSVTVALDGGLFGTAKKAASETELRAEEEMLLSSIMGAIGRDGKVELENLKLPDGFIKITDEICKSPSGNIFSVTENGEIINGTNGVIPVTEEELTEGLKIAIDEGKVDKVVKEIKDGKELRAVIPAGFQVSTKKGENTISGGLVISDADGNEFVWVPCATDVNDINGLTLYAQDKKYNGKDGKQYKYAEYSDWKDEGGDFDSVSKYGGFYVGRYEAGIPNNAPFYANTNGAEYKVKDGTTNLRNTTSYIPVSKARQPSWNYIDQVNAKIVSEKMYSSSKSVKSSLIDSYAWDTIANWLASENSEIVKNGSNYGNYLDSRVSATDLLYATYKYNYSTWLFLSGPKNYQKETVNIPARIGSGEQTLYEIATGSMENTKILNIYDLLGNMWEWTTEVGHYDAGSDATEYAVRRGGSFYTVGSESIVTRFGSAASSHPEFMNGFRVVLYIKL